MATLEWVRFGVGAAFLLGGLLTFAFELLGVFRFHYVLNRMQIAATGDTLGIGFSLIGLMIMSGWNFTTLKFMLIVILLWFSSPVSSHMLARLEVMSNPHLGDHCELPEWRRMKETGWRHLWSLTGIGRSMITEYDDLYEYLISISHRVCYSGELYKEFIKFRADLYVVQFSHGSDLDHAGIAGLSDHGGGSRCGRDDGAVFGHAQKIIQYAHGERPESICTDAGFTGG